VGSNVHLLDMSRKDPSLAALRPAVASFEQGNAAAPCTGVGTVTGSGSSAGGITISCE